MSVDKLVDSTQLDSDLTSVANAIRAKSGGSGQLAFPSGFVSEIGNISGGDTPVLPTGYTRLDFIESSGTQVINSGVHMTMNTKVQVYFHYVNGTFTGWLGPIASKAPLLACSAKNSYSTSSGYWSFGNKTDFWNYVIYSSEIDSSYTDDVRFAINDTLDKDTAICIYAPRKEDQTKTVGATSLGTDNENTRICLFGRMQEDGTYDRFGSFRIFRAKIWDGDTLLRDFVPCMKDSNEEIGMYDIAGNSFYGNSGTGVFVGGMTT